ncbi:amino acid ABC transporter ATP-binding protein [Roseomonas sp. OT10]|nr:amino acid ABC transporter ATP-binding protein [Roseomonas sp. OT10]
MVSFAGVSKWFGEFQALRDIDAEVARGETVVLCGPSGSGKSTLIRTVNRLEPIQQGRVVADGIDVNAPGTDLNRLRSRIGFVFQQLNLFPHLRAVDNVALPLIRVLGQDKATAHGKAVALLERVGLSHRLRHWPAELSGGEQQRVAIARTLALDPPIMLFDEPTSALDPEMVGEVLEIIQGLARSGRTILCVTHEMGFARNAADRIWFLEGGRILEQAPPEAFFHAPRHPLAQRFLGTILTH